MLGAVVPDGHCGAVVPGKVGHATCPVPPQSLPGNVAVTLMWMVAFACCMPRFGGVYESVRMTSPPCCVPVEKVLAFMVPALGSLSVNVEPTVTSRSPFGS